MDQGLYVTAVFCIYSYIHYFPFILKKPSYNFIDFSKLSPNDCMTFKQTNNFSVILFTIVESVAGSDSDQSDSDRSRSPSPVRQKPRKEKNKQIKKPQKLELSANEIGRLLVKAVDNGELFDQQFILYPITWF